jgi:hypothetical protein
LQALKTVDHETIWLLIRQPTMPRSILHLVIGAIYRPPDAPNGPVVNHLINNLDFVLQQHPYAGVILLGDLNALNDKLLRDYPLKQVVGEPTHGKATLDKIYTNVADWCSKSIIIPNIASSDHCAVVMFPTTNKWETSCSYTNVALRSN